MLSSVAPPHSEVGEAPPGSTRNLFLTQKQLLRRSQYGEQIQGVGAGAESSGFHVPPYTRLADCVAGNHEYVILL